VRLHPGRALGVAQEREGLIHLLLDGGEVLGGGDPVEFGLRPPRHAGGRIQAVVGACVVPGQYRQGVQARPDGIEAYPRARGHVHERVAPHAPVPPYPERRGPYPADHRDAEQGQQRACGVAGRWREQRPRRGARGGVGAPHRIGDGAHTGRAQVARHRPLAARPGQTDATVGGHGHHQPAEAQFATERAGVGTHG
jgi:hypothetical protein